MDEIRAFVGHSFFEEDLVIVSRFLNYFDQIAKLHPKFSWRHAEAAEPKLLAEKVIALVEGKNTFIGICTKKERVAAESAFSTVIFRPLYRKVKDPDLQWKTSDWIIQEIGLAKGRGLEIILLVEEGVRRPGGLQGDVEYIPFQRAAPEKAFGKILEMITALSPRSASTTVLPPEASSTSEEQASKPVDEMWKAPSTAWGRDQYEHAMFRMIVTEDTDGAERINKAYLETAEAREEINLDTWEARTESLRVRFGKRGTLHKLEALAEKHPSNPEILQDLALALTTYDSFEEAATRFEAAAQASTEKSDVMRLMGLAALQHARVGSQGRVLEITAQLRELVKSISDCEVLLLGTLRELAEREKQNDALIATMERLVELRPDSITTRFSLAYAHTHSGNNDLALINYLLIPEQDRGAGHGIISASLMIAFKYARRQ